MTKKTKKLIAVFPGTFDPPTNGHLEIIEDAAYLGFRKLIVIPLKKFSESRKQNTFFALKERLEMLKNIIASRKLKNVVVKTLNGDNNLKTAIKNFIKKEGINYIVRGVRPDNTKQEKELANDWTNCLKIPVILLDSSAKNATISSGRVREKIKRGASIAKLVPKEVREFIETKLKLRAFRS